MKVIPLLSRKISITKQLSNPVPLIQLPTPEFAKQFPFPSEDTCSRILDRCPNIKTLKKLHSRIVIDPYLRSNPSLGIKLMRVYAYCGQPAVTRQVFDEITDKNVAFFNVMIGSFVNNHFFRDVLLVYKTMCGQGFHPDNCTYPCVLKACSGSGNLLVVLLIHGAVVKVGLDLNLYIGNGLVSMYGKRKRLVEARKVLDEMPRKDLVSWNSLLAGLAQNGQFDDALELCREMEVLELRPDAVTMGSLFPAVTNTSSDNVMYVKEMCMKLTEKSLVSWNVMIAVYVNNAMPNEAVELYSQKEAHDIEPDAVTISSVLPACGDLCAVSLGRRILLEK